MTTAADHGSMATMTGHLDAEDAARAAGLRIRDLTELAELGAACALFNEIWNAAPDDPPVTAEILRAMSSSGGYVVGAYDGDRLVAASVAFFGPPRERSLHSHITGVAADLRGRSVGRALKLHQREWALERGVDHVTWTFDPLLRRNAWFNLVKLGARPVAYLTNFYGGLQDAVNAGDETDRLLVRWDLDAAAPGAPPPAESAVAALTVGPDGGPVPTDRRGAVLLVGVPGDIEALRRQDPPAARAWRVAIRETLGGLMDAGARVIGFDRDGGYVVDTAPEGRER